MALEKASSCKVNLILNILGKRADGFHELETLMHPVNICDDMTFERAGSGLQLTCSHPELPTDSRNLVYRESVGSSGWLHVNCRPEPARSKVMSSQMFTGCMRVSNS